MKEDTSDNRRKRMADHDQFLKKLLMTFLGDLLAIVTPHLSEKLKPEEADFLMQETFSAIVGEGQRAIADLVAKVPMLSEALRLVLAHMEVAGESRSVMKERMLYYYMHLRLNYRMLVIPIVVNLSGGETALRRVEVLDEVEGDVINIFSYYELSLERCTAEDFLEMPLPLAWGLAAVMRPKNGDRAEQKLRCLQAIARGKLDEKREEMLFNFVETYLQLEEHEQHRYAELVASAKGEDVKLPEMTWAGKIEAQGEAKGRIAGMRDLIARMIESRFGPLPEAVRTYLQGLEDPDELNRIGDRLLEAHSLAELGFST